MGIDTLTTTTMANSIRVNQAVNQLSSCNTTTPSPTVVKPTDAVQARSGISVNSICLNSGENDADIHRKGSFLDLLIRKEIDNIRVLY